MKLYIFSRNQWAWHIHRWFGVICFWLIQLVRHDKPYEHQISSDYLFTTLSTKFQDIPRHIKGIGASVWQLTCFIVSFYLLSYHLPNIWTCHPVVSRSCHGQPSSGFHLSLLWMVTFCPTLQRPCSIQETLKTLRFYLESIGMKAPTSWRTEHQASARTMRASSPGRTSWKVKFSSTQLERTDRDTKNNANLSNCKNW